MDHRVAEQIGRQCVKIWLTMRGECFFERRVGGMGEEGQDFKA